MTSIRKTTTLAALLFAATAMAGDARSQQCAASPCPAPYAQPYGYAPTTAMVPVRRGLFGRRIAWVARYQAPQAVPYAAMPQAVQPATIPPGPAIASPGAAGGEAAAFLGWLNRTRAGCGLAAVGYDASLEPAAAQNNALQATRGLGHHAPNHGWWSCAAGPPRPNGVLTSLADACAALMGSAAHRGVLLNPSIQWVGIAGSGSYWTVNCR
jgi:hypothetical protein